MLSISGATKWRKHILSVLFVGCGVAALYVAQMQNFLLFHSVVEVFSILIAFAVFIITWNAREELENSFIVILGVSFLFVGGVDLLHTLAYKGMGVFPEASADLPTQLWIFGRYLQAFSLLGAGVVGLAVNERHSLAWNDRQFAALMSAYTVVTVLGLSSIFVFDLFPQAYVPGEGLTQFKIVSEYVIVALFGLSLVLLYRQEMAFNRRVFQLLAVSILLTMGSELAFTFYVSVYGISNAIGHFFKLGAFYLIYLAVVKTGIKEPQKTLYRALARREAEARKFKKAADHSGHAILITDRDGIIEYVNAAWEDMTGYSAAEALGENPRILKSGEHDEEFYEEMWATILAGDIWEGEVIDERKNGERFVIYQTIAPIFGEGWDIQGFVAINDEITERKEYEKRLESDLRQSVKQLQVLARVLRHNIRNEMNVILGNAEMVQESTDDADVEEMAGLVVTAGKRLLAQANKQREIVQLLLESSTPMSIDLREVVEDIVTRLESKYPQAEIAVEIPEGLEITTLPEFRRAIEELVENAIIHSDRETPEISIRARQRERTVEIRVADNGPGIPPVEQRVVKGEAEIDALLHSSGLGLWLVNNIVTKAGGTIRFEDAEPRGSIVVLVVPRERTHGESTEPPRLTEEDPETVHSPLREFRRRHRE